MGNINLEFISSIEYLRRNHFEQTPNWLSNLNKNSFFPFNSFFDSQVVFYPGYGEDGHAVELFAKGHASHCFVLSDYFNSLNSLISKLDDKSQNFYGYTSIFREVISESDLIPKNWIPHCNDEELRKFNLRTRSRNKFEVYGLIEVLERKYDFEPSHVPSRIALLFLGSDGHATYDALFCQEFYKSPFAVLIQDHGFGGNYSDFGEGGLISLISQRENRYPKLIVSDASTKIWKNYQRISGVNPSVGGFYKVERFLHHQSNNEK